MPSCTVILRNKIPFLVSLSHIYYIYTQPPNFESLHPPSSRTFPSREKGKKRRTNCIVHDPSTSRNGRLNPRRRADAPFHQKLQGNKSKIAAAAADSPPLSLFPLLRPIRLSLTAEERNGRLSVGAHCVQITTNHLFLWIVPRSAGSIVPPLVNSSFRFRASIIKDRGGARRIAPRSIIPLVPFDLLPDSRASAPFDLSFARRTPSPDPSRKIMMTLLDPARFEFVDDSFFERRYGGL